MQIIAIYIAIFNNIALNKDLIGYNKSLVIQKITNKMVINLNAEEFATYINAVEKLVT